MSSAKKTYALIRVRDNETPLGIVSGFSTEEAAKYYARPGRGFHRNLHTGGVHVYEIENLPKAELEENLKAQLKAKAEHEAEQERVTAERVAKAEEEKRAKAIQEAAEEKQRQAFLEQRRQWERDAAAEYDKAQVQA